MSDVNGLIAPQFEDLATRLSENLASGEDLGASVCLTIEGEVVVDIHGGWEDRRQTTPWTERSLPCVYSSGKFVTALLVARAVDEGLLDYEAPIAEIWPEFAANGKEKITLAMAMSHQAGLCGLTEEISPAAWLDWDVICEALADQAPLWPPGTANGYHPQTFGFLAGEVLRRATGKTIGQMLREDFFETDGIDVHCGVTEEAYGRTMKMIKPPAAPDLGDLNSYTSVAFLKPWSSPAKVDAKDWAMAEIPASNMHATASGLARIMTPYANDGALEGTSFISTNTLAEAMKERCNRNDLVLPFNLSWAAGMMRNSNFVYGPNENTVGQSGFGGSCVFADPENRLTFSYVMNKMSPVLMGDPRPLHYIEAVYSAL